jgi:hypothetical protein
MKIETSASGDKDARSITLEYEFGQNLDETAKIFGKELTYNKAVAQMKVDFQSAVRTKLKAGTADKEIVEQMRDWKPGMRAPGKSKVEKLQGLFNSLSPEEKAALRKQMGLK